MARWTFEPGHTAAEFKARHMMVTRDPDGYIIQVGQPSQKMIDLFAQHAP